MEDQEKICGTCKYFCRHYTHRGRNQFYALDAGHCMNPHLRDKQAETPACHRYAKGREAQEARNPMKGKII